MVDWQLPGTEIGQSVLVHNGPILEILRYGYWNMDICRREFLVGPK